MNKISFLIILSLLDSLVSLHAQTQKGNGWFNSTVGTNYSKTNTNGSETRNFLPNVSVSYSHFLKRRVLLGASVDCSLQEYRISLNNGKTRSEVAYTNFSTEVFGGYVFDLKPFYINIRGGLRYGGRHTFAENIGTQTTTSKERYWSLGPAASVNVLYMLSPRWALQAGLSSSTWPIEMWSFRPSLTYLVGRPADTQHEALAESPQTRAGGWVLGTSFNFSRGKRDDRPSNQSNNNWSRAITLNGGYFVTQNALVGLELTTGWGKMEQNKGSVPKETQFTWIIAPYYKYYLSQNRLRPFVILKPSYANIEQKNFNVSDRRTEWAAEAGTGLAYLLGKKWLIEANLANLRYTKSSNEGSSGSSWSGRATLSPSFTLQYVLH
jgi:Outer membrane protein beta-barrel domain